MVMNNHLFKHLADESKQFHVNGFQAPLTGACEINFELDALQGDQVSPAGT